MEASDSTPGASEFPVGADVWRDPVCGHTAQVRVCLTRVPEGMMPLCKTTTRMLPVPKLGTGARCARVWRWDRMISSDDRDFILRSELCAV